MYKLGMQWVTFVLAVVIVFKMFVLTNWMRLGLIFNPVHTIGIRNMCTLLKSLSNFCNVKMGLIDQSNSNYCF